MRAASTYKNIVVLTGAGISAAAGLPTYRGPGGLWTDEKLAQLSHTSALQTRRREATNMFWSMRSALAGLVPTAAHRALAAFEASLPQGAQFTLITQNVDGLHQAAGSKNVCEYHGSLARWRCEICHEVTTPPAGDAPVHCDERTGDAPVHCDERMRPCAVLFGEMISAGAERTAKHALRDCDLFVAIGTSGTVAPASSFVSWAHYNNARSVLLNLEAFDDARQLFREVRTGPADELVPAFFATA